VRRLVLWDVDGTLVAVGEVGRIIFAEAFRAVVGRPPNELDRTVMAGRTDHEIALEILERHGVQHGERHLPAFAEALAVAMEAKTAQVREHGRALPGARAALAAVARRPDVVQSLLTGNIEPNAAVKLASFELDGFLDFEVGGFGSDDRHRPNLVEVARRKARAKYGAGFDGRATVVIGDTPLDVAAALAGGARPVAVATGPYTVDELRATGAEAVLPDLRDTQAVVHVLLEQA
jgi:phosphoglycolate phosphatase-like HAD superfamily hydrolase